MIGTCVTCGASMDRLGMQCVACSDKGKAQLLELLEKNKAVYLLERQAMQREMLYLSKKLGESK